MHFFFVGGMMGPSPAQARIPKFGTYEVDRDSGELYKSGVRQKLTSQPFEVLCLLLEHPQQIVTREEFQQRIWSKDTFVDYDLGLRKAITRLRESLGDSAENPRFIETIPRRGYRFIAPVDVLEKNREARYQDAIQLREELKHLRRRSARKRLWVVASIVALTIFFAAIAFLAKRTRWPDLESVRISKLTDTGRAREVAISADGRYVAYSSSYGEEESLRLHQVATHSDVQLLDIGPSFHGLTFSADENFVYFVRANPNDSDVNDLYSIPLLGGVPHRIIEDIDSPITFSPDGKELAFERGVPGRNVLELRIAKKDGTNDRLLAAIRDGDIRYFQPGPSWSADGRTIVMPVPILGKEKSWTLASVSVADGNIRQMYSGSDSLGRPVWLNASRLLIPAYSRPYQRTQLWAISYPGGMRRQFTNDLANYDHSLDVTSDGHTVAAVASSITSNIWVAAANNLSNPKQITFGELPMVNVTETAKGGIVSESEDGRLWTVSSHESKRERFNEATEVAWLSRCGAFVLFAYFGADAVTITRANANGSHEIKLLSGNVRYPACSNDGMQVFYVTGRFPQKIWQISSEGGPATEIATVETDGVEGPLDISPDGSLISYPSDENPPGWGIVVRPVAGGVPLKKFKVPGGIRRVHWSPNGMALQYLMTQHGATNIWEQPLAGGKPKQLTRFTSGRIFDFTWSFDHRRLFLARGDITSDVVLLSNLH
jgi:eukaryotic-like serine/threonine-protein kinase